MVGTSDASIDIDRNESKGIYGGKYDIDDNGDLSYHSSDGSEEDDSDVDRSLGNGTEGTSPPANARNTARQSLLGRQIDDLPDWLQEMIDNPAYGLSYLLSAPIAKCFPCITCNNQIDVTDPRGWIRAFLRKSGATAWEVFDKFFEEIGPDMDWDSDDGLRNMWDRYYMCPDPAYIQSLQATRDSTIHLTPTTATCTATHSSHDKVPNAGLFKGDANATATTCNSSVLSGDRSADISHTKDIIMLPAQ